MNCQDRYDEDDDHRAFVARREHGDRLIWKLRELPVSRFTIAELRMILGLTRSHWHAEGWSLGEISELERLARREGIRT